MKFLDLIRRCFRQVTSAAFVLFFYSHSHATEPLKVKVVKSQGKSSLIKVSNNQPGDLPIGFYTLTPITDASVQVDDDPRDKSISFSLEGSSLTKSSTTGTTETKIESKQFSSNFNYGWNKKRFEYGPYINYSFSTEGTFDSKRLMTGLFLDWNFTPNVEGKKWIPGLRLQAGVGQEDNSGLPKSYSLTSMQFGFILKYFSFQSDFAVFGEIAASSDSASLDTTTIKTSGSIARLGIINYF